MEWLAVFTWGGIALVSLPLGVRALTTLGGGPVALVAVSGFALCVLFIVVGGSQPLAWATVGCAVVGFIAVAFTAAWLISADRHVSDAGQASEELQASAAGLLLPLFAVAALLSLGVALGATAV
jgi:hypothetical protein